MLVNGIEVATFEHELSSSHCELYLHLESLSKAIGRDIKSTILNYKSKNDGSDTLIRLFNYFKRNENVYTAFQQHFADSGVPDEVLVPYDKYLIMLGYFDMRMQNPELLAQFVIDNPDSSIDVFFDLLTHFEMKYLSWFKLELDNRNDLGFFDKYSPQNVPLFLIQDGTPKYIQFDFAECIVDELLTIKLDSLLNERIEKENKENEEQIKSFEQTIRLFLLHKYILNPAQTLLPLKEIAKHYESPLDMYDDFMPFMINAKSYDQILEWINNKKSIVANMEGKKIPSTLRKFYEVGFTV